MLKRRFCSLSCGQMATSTSSTVATKGSSTFVKLTKRPYSGFRRSVWRAEKTDPSCRGASFAVRSIGSGDSGAETIMDVDHADRRTVGSRILVVDNEKVGDAAAVHEGHGLRRPRLRPAGPGGAGHHPVGRPSGGGGGGSH